MTALAIARFSAINPSKFTDKEPANLIVKREGLLLLFNPFHFNNYSQV
jgi:hypothetical protein